MKPEFDEARAHDPAYLEQYASELIAWDDENGDEEDKALVLSERQLRRRHETEVYSPTGTPVDRITLRFAMS
jgi:hypothetical protein